MDRHALSASSPSVRTQTPDALHLPRQRRAFRCPIEDKRGVSSTGNGAHTTAGASGSQTTFTCTYEGGAGTCSYDADGVLLQLEGSSECPDGTPAQTSPSTTQIVTKTQTQIVTQSAVPPSFPTLSSSSDSSASSTPAISSTPLSPSSDHSSASLPSSARQTSLGPSSSSPSSTPQTSETSLPVVGQSTLSSSKRIAAGAIAGIVLGVLALLGLALILAVCVRRARRRRRAEELQPESYFVINPPVLTAAATPAQAKSALSQSGATLSTVAFNRQEYLTVQQRAVRKQLEALQSSVGGGSNHLEQAMQQNEALRARIRMLEREMQSQWGLGLSDSPPAYLD
ncbi:hypothetical protein DFH08DRAFT_972699 [Mycena albidolilacea]|uniref:Uncharacterized protein n=1 Tax=Mycena albidolilacea TaxID=1033008 RepID=A0AAD7EEI7_9AGAR|nr:hypothetical protein DFH08DRAFT_972699 [Mycena albidolilacea]